MSSWMREVKSDADADAETETRLEYHTWSFWRLRPVPGGLPISGAFSGLSEWLLNSREGGHYTIYPGKELA